MVCVYLYDTAREGHHSVVSMASSWPLALAIWLSDALSLVPTVVASLVLCGRVFSAVGSFPLPVLRLDGRSQALPSKQWLAGLPAAEHTGQLDGAEHVFA